MYPPRPGAAALGSTSTVADEVRTNRNSWSFGRRARQAAQQRWGVLPGCETTYS
ncbi:MAG: hypothetical protein ACRDJF_06615 [Actinomycetota bacterium]